MSKPEPATTTKTASAWHAGIAFEMQKPVLPDDADPALVEEIENQREKHVVFSSVLKRIATAEKPQ